MRKLFSVFYSIAVEVFHLLINLGNKCNIHQSVKNNVRHRAYCKSHISSTERIICVRECKNSALKSLAQKEIVFHSYLKSSHRQNIKSI